MKINVRTLSLEISTFFPLLCFNQRLDLHDIEICEERDRDREFLRILNLFLKKEIFNEIKNSQNEGSNP